MSIKCCTCQREVDAKLTKADNPRLPKGWKRTGADIWCSACWRSTYVQRSIQIPIVSPIDLEWSELRERVRAAQQAVRNIANWAYRELLKTDPGRQPGDEKLVKRTWPYLYGQRAECPRWRQPLAKGRISGGDIRLYACGPSNA